MLDPQITHLLETAINTSCKLAIVLTFMENGSWCATPSEIAARVCRDIWSVEEALQELAEDGILFARDRRYCYASGTDIRTRLRALQEIYAHPLERNELNSLVRELERYAPYRKELQLPMIQPRTV